MLIKIKIFCFIALFLTILIYIGHIFIPKNYNFNPTRINNIENIDILFIGPSTTHTIISPMYIWDKFKITSYNLASSSQYVLSSLYLLKKYHKENIKVICFDLTVAFIDKNKPAKHNSIYTWYFDFFDRISYYNSIGKKLFLPEYFFIYSLNSYHDRWKNLKKEDFLTSDELYGLRPLNKGSFRQIPQEPIDIDNFTVDPKITIEAIEHINKIYEYAKKNNIHIIFWNPPYTKKWSKLYNQVILFKKYASENNLTYIDFNDKQFTNLFDYKFDFYDPLHLNISAAHKIEDYIVSYAIDKFNLKTHANQSDYNKWQNDFYQYDRIINNNILKYSNSFSNWKKYALYDNYTVMISINGDVLRKLPDALKNDLKSFGLKKYNTNKANMRYAAIIDDNKVFFEEISNKPVTYKGRMKNIVNLLVSSDGKATISVSGKPRSKNKYGLNFVIYDKVNREIVDSIWIDPNKPDIVRR